MLESARHVRTSGVFEVKDIVRLAGSDKHGTMPPEDSR
jgi:hypothetical protein